MRPIFAVLAGLLLQTDAALHAQPYPTHPVRIIVPYAPGGPADIVSRLVAQKLGERLGQNFIVDNRPGASGLIGADIVAKATPDGHTLLLCSSSPQVNSPMLMARKPYDAARDITQITVIVSVPYLLLVNPGSGIGSVNELLALARSKPGKINYGSSGTGSISHLAGAIFGSMADVDIVHVAYKGSSAAATNVTGGHIEFTGARP